MPESYLSNNNISTKLLKIMKSKTYIQTIILLFLVCVFSFCSKTGGVEQIPFTEYSLEGTSCQWNVHTYSNDGVLIINNSDELEKYITSTDGNYPYIDFSKHTLLSARGTTSAGVSEINTFLQKNSTKRFDLKVVVFQNALTFPEGWHIAILTPKIGDNAIITLVPKIIH